MLALLSYYSVAKLSSFLICKMGIAILPSFNDVLRAINKHLACRLLSW